MKNLENYGVLEMDAREIRETDGGLFGWDDILIGFIVASIYDYDEAIAGFKAGYNAAMNK